VLISAARSSSATFERSPTNSAAHSRPPGAPTATNGLPNSLGRIAWAEWPGPNGLGRMARAEWLAFIYAMFLIKGVRRTSRG
jgi:hypothetical protein